MKLSTQQTHKISPYLYMQFAEPLGTADSSVDAGWDYVKNCWQPKLIDILKELEPPMIRWGGCFASYYHWKEAVGEQRVPMLNLCWDGVYSNAVGTKEVAELCETLGAEALMVVNMESDGRMHWAYPRAGEDRFGTAEEAAEWVSYCNAPEHPLRKSHGREKPYGITYWQIGNETSYDKNGYPCEKAAEVTLKFAKAMKKADPNIKLIAWGDDGWAPRMCEVAGEEIDYIAFHHHFDSGLPDSPLFGTEYRQDPQKTWEHLMYAHHSLEEHLKKIRKEVEPYGKRLVMTEGHFALPGRNRCEVLSTWGAGAAYARCLNVIERNSDILDIATMADFFGNRWQVNAVLLPTPIGSGEAYLQPVGEVMKLFSHHIGTHSVELEAIEGVDATASRSEDTLYLHLVNTSMTEARDIPLELDGEPVEKATAFEIVSDPMTEITPLNTQVFKPVEKAVSGIYQLPPAAVCALEIPLTKIV